jgi:hypothetical protein
LQTHPAAQPAIASIVSQGIMRPVAVGQFAPDQPDSLGDFAVAAQSLFGLPPPSRPVQFTDVPPGSQYYAAIQAIAPYLHRQLLCFGCALSTELYVGQPVSRAEANMVVVSVLVAQNKLQLLTPPQANDVLATAPDAAVLPPPARVYFATGIKNGILPLADGSSIAPAKPHSRADIAVLLDSVQTKFKIPLLKRTQ